VSLLKPIRDTWVTSIGVARERARTVGRRRLLAAWVTQALVLLLVGWIVPGVLVESPVSALLAALVLGLLNALVRPILILLTLPLNVLSVGLLSLVINALMLVIAAPFVPGLEISSFASALAAAILITVVTTLVSVVLSSDQDDTFYAELTRRLAVVDQPAVAGARGLIVVQIDGLAAPILRNAIRVGLTPWMASHVRTGRYRLVEWEASPSSQTSASQAGILHGNNDGIPAFRWFEKENGRLMVSNHPPDAAEIERRISDGRGLLAGGGTSVSNLFSGDAARTLFTMSRMQPDRAADVDAFSLYFVDPAAFVRTIALTIGELIKEFLEARRQKAMDIQPRIHRGGAFPVLRAVTNVVMRDLNVTFVLNAISRGTPIMYVDFVDYDEVAHHAGPERLESLRSLSGVDRVLASIERATTRAPREYEIVVLSDHGQSQGATFNQRYGVSLDEVIRALMGQEATSVAVTDKGEGWGPVNALLTEIRQRPGVAGRAASSALKSRTVDGAVELGEAAAPMTAEPTQPTVIVCASGNLAHAYFTVGTARMTIEEIDAAFPGLVEGLVAHPGIGFVMVRTDARGTVVIGRGGVHDLADGRVDGDDPLSPFGPRAADHLRRLDGFQHTGDIVLNSSYDADLEEVAAFEELVGSHGGFGGPQVRPFILAPKALAFDDGPIVGAPAVYRQLVRWADGLGVGPESGAADTPAATARTQAVPRGITAVAVLLALSSLFWLVLGLVVLIGEFVLGGEEPLILALVLLAFGSGGLLTAWGLWRRRGWAWLACLVLEALTILQILATIATEGLGGILNFGLASVVTGFLIFFYLTRPHVAAAFGRGRRSEQAADG